MNLPQNIYDTSILKHEPLCSYIAMYEECESRSQYNKIVSDFVEAMQKDNQATLACKQWTHLMYEDALPRDKFRVTSNEEELYKVFLEYHFRLYQGDLKEVEKYRCHVVRNSIGVTRPDARRSMQGARSEGQRDKRSSRLQRVSGQNQDRLQAETDNHHSHQGNAVMASSQGLTSHSTTDNSVTQLGTLSGTGTRLSSPPEATNQSKRSTSKKEKKRKASSQKPDVITPSDASEDERMSSETQAVTISHRPKRIALNSSRNLTKDQLAKKISTRRSKLTHREHTSISQAPSSLTTPRSRKFGFSHQMARRSAGPPLSGRKRNDGKLSDVFKRRTQANSKVKRLRKIMSASDLPARPRKRLRSSSMSAIDGEREGVSESIISEPIVEKLPLIDPPSTQENVRVKAKARKKRARPEYEMGSVAPREDTQADYYELLGPDKRPSRPIPRKVCNERSVPLADEDTSIHRTQCGLPSLQQVDQLLGDVASNALALQREEVTPDLPDWTQDEEQEPECDDPDDQDETNDIQSTTTTSAASVVRKPSVPARPHIWAQSRQEVCESFEHFRSYHSGVYSKDDIVKGYLLGAYAASRDKFYHDGKLIISHGGGKSESVLECRKGRKRYQTDQDQEASDKSVRALLKTWKDRRPLVLLADDKYALFPYDLTSGNYTYVVLGLYWISHAWAECQSSRDGSGRIVRWKFAFQWCEGQGDPWWASQQDMDITPQVSIPFSGPSTSPTNGPPHLVNTSENPNMQCESCREQSPFVYEQGWMCLNPYCEKFWSINDEEPKQLDYREEFLRLLPQSFERLPNIMPARVVEIPNGVATTFACSKGWHCVKCGRLSCRFKWEHWECSNCGFGGHPHKSKHEVKGRLRSPKEFWNQRPPKDFLHSRLGKDSGILACRLEPIDLGEHKGFTNRLTFILPHDRGKIHIILGTPSSNGDADHIFQLYQQQAFNGELKLRRYPLRNHRARGQLLTNYFSQNSGEPYQYVGGTGNTVPFDQAPECVQRALAAIKEKAHLALHIDIPFNEILSAAYMERQKMSFHSDSEKGLGPVVASLSLGSAALMHFRPHVNVGEPKGKSTYALTLVLRHGDVLVMEGDGVQKYYEHTVVPMNFRIAATARCIGST